MTVRRITTRLYQGKSLTAQQARDVPPARSRLPAHVRVKKFRELLNMTIDSGGNEFEISFWQTQLDLVNREIEQGRITTQHERDQSEWAESSPRKSSNKLPTQ